MVYEDGLWHVSQFNKLKYKRSKVKALKMTNMYSLTGDITHIIIFSNSFLAKCLQSYIFHPAYSLVETAVQVSNVEFGSFTIFPWFNPIWHKAYCRKESLKFVSWKMQNEKKTMTTFIGQKPFAVAFCNRGKLPRVWCLNCVKSTTLEKVQL